MTGSSSEAVFVQSARKITLIITLLFTPRALEICKCITRLHLSDFDCQWESQSLIRLCSSSYKAFWYFCFNLKPEIYFRAGLLDCYERRGAALLQKLSRIGVCTPQLADLRWKLELIEQVYIRVYVHSLFFYTLLFIYVILIYFLQTLHRTVYWERGGSSSTLSRWTWSRQGITSCCPQTPPVRL